MIPIIICQFNISNSIKLDTNELEGQINLKKSYFNVSCNPIFINGDATGVGAHNWSWAESQLWCTLDNGIYYLENLTINGNENDNCIEIRNSNVNLVINNCTLLNSTADQKAGITLINVNNTLLSNNNCSFNSWGIFIKGAGTPTDGFNNYNHSIINNSFIDNFGFDLYLMNSYNSTIFNNTIKKTNYLINSYYSAGIYISTGHEVSIEENKIYNCSIGICGTFMKIKKNFMINSGIELDSTSIAHANSHFIDITNNLNGLPVYYYANVSRLILTDSINPGQLILANCNDSFISDFQFSYTNEGMQLYYCFNNSISNISSSNGVGGVIARKSGNNIYSDNTFNDNSIYGICLFSCNDSTIINTNTNNNGIYGGIYLWNTNNSKIIGNILNDSSQGIYSGMCYDNTISRNIISNNDVGIEFFVFCEENLIYNNSFIGNDIQTTGTISFNYWNNSIIGNYWDDYPGVDADFNGVGDIIYNISQSPLSQDFIPIWDSTIEIISPSQGENFTSNIAPTFNIVFYDLHINYTWYSINGGENITFSSNGQFDPVIWGGIWDNLNYTDTITIRFYFNNTEGYIVYKEVSGTKAESSDDNGGSNIPEEPRIPSFNLLIFSSSIITIIFITIWSKRKQLKC